MPRVGCAGILVADTFCGPLATLPKPGELLAIDDLPQSAGGCAANVAISLARQSIHAEVSGAVGNDASAEILLTELARAGVGCDHIVRLQNLPTSKTVILLVEGDDRRYIHAFGANSGYRIADIDRDWVLGLDVFYVGGVFALPAFDLTELAELLAACRAAGVRTVIDVVVPGGRSVVGALDAVLPHVDFFLPNEDEAAALTGETSPVTQAARLREAGAGTVIVTCGSAGALAFDGERQWRSPAHRFEAVDPSGSGDAFTAGVIAGIVGGRDLAGSLRYGAALGASAARTVGTTRSVFNQMEAEAFIAAQPLEIREAPWKSR